MMMLAGFAGIFFSIARRSDAIPLLAAATERRSYRGTRPESGGSMLTVPTLLFRVGRRLAVVVRSAFSLLAR
jgi:hypothetical protein